MYDSPRTGCARRTTPTIYKWRAIIEWSWHVNSMVACCHGAKLCAHAARASDRNTMCCDQDVKVVPRATFTKRTCGRCGSLKEEGYSYNLSAGVALNVQFTTNGMCAKYNTHIYVARTSNDRVISLGDLYCCLLPVWNFAHLPLGLSHRNTCTVRFALETLVANRGCGAGTEIWARHRNVFRSSSKMIWSTENRKSMYQLYSYDRITDEVSRNNMFGEKGSCAKKTWSAYK